MDSTSHNFDVERFARIWAMASHVPHDGADNAHERANARRMAEAMAGRAGITLEQAISLLGMGGGKAGFSAPPKPRRPTFPLHWLEEMLQKAGFDVRAERVVPTDEVLNRIERAIPQPKTVREALAELRAWDDLEAERQSKVWPYALTGAALLRRDYVEQFAAEAKAGTLADAVARADWLRHKLENCIPGDFDEEATVSVANDLRRMAARLETLTKTRAQPRTKAESTESPTPTARRTNAEKRAAILSILDGEGGETLSLREIAERAGVSHENVRSVKRSRGGR